MGSFNLSDYEPVKTGWPDFGQNTQTDVWQLTWFTTLTVSTLLSQNCTGKPRMNTRGPLGTLKKQWPPVA
jgi:hypothetical protein